MSSLSMTQASVPQRARHILQYQSSSLRPRAFAELLLGFVPELVCPEGSPTALRVALVDILGAFLVLVIEPRLPPLLVLVLTAVLGHPQLLKPPLHGILLQGFLSSELIYGCNWLRFMSRTEEALIHLFVVN
uniref:Uncharacterized protein n=1 Tax=Triticum urartu TaxID=4572 RepID=A0A8R7URH9_TRIUA